MCVYVGLKVGDIFTQTKMTEVQAKQSFFLLELFRKFKTYDTFEKLILDDHYKQFEVNIVPTFLLSYLQ